MRAFAIASVLTLLASGAPCLADDAGLVVQGAVEHPGPMTPAGLAALPMVTLQVSHPGPKGVQTDSYTGALLWTVIDAAKPVDQAGNRSHLQHTMLARGRDGYAVAVAMGEIDPDFEAKQILIATSENGKALALPRLVVPGDVKAGRSVRDLVSIEVR